MLLFSKLTPPWLFTIAIMTGLVLPLIFQDGMFVDGIFYSVVSKNMATGHGSFWSPWYSQSGFGGMQGFHEHPPLVFGMQSLFFLLLGKGLYTERIYTLCTFIASALLIHATWKKISPTETQKDAGWLPLLLWATTPLVFWSFSNNMQENSMGVFVLFSVYFFTCSLKAERELPLLLLSGASVFLASFSKGIPGLFPLAAPVLYWLIVQEVPAMRMIYQSAVLLLTVCLLYCGILLIPAARECLSVYFFQRLAVRVGHFPTVESHFWILGRVLLEIAPAAALVLVALVIRKVRRKKASADVRMAAFFTAMGLAGTVPLALTLVQRGFYFVPALPFFSLGFALLLSPALPRLAARISEGPARRFLNILGVLLAGAALAATIFLAGKPKRDAAMLADIYIMGPHIPPDSIIGVPHEMWNEYSFEGYFLRYFDVSMIEGTSFPYYLTPKHSAGPPPPGFSKIELPTKTYDLYRKN
jgi:4-amino-4-deoxy-L-arabinose transferase-like glycosyltransferase